ncbi:MAG: protein-L-isoaspartate(D-aspartate) O-methyltransferase [Desulfomonile sp.]|nr:protein-L-isoaspartate(D-aspartate) O-methyltransferase [Desulfomonile sp.]
MAHLQRPSQLRIRCGSPVAGLALLAAATFLPAVLFLSVGGAAARPDIAEMFSERRQERETMVFTQLKGHFRTEIADKVVIDAMLKVPRHLFIPPANRAFAYYDTPVPIGHGQTISQPYIVALMTQALDVRPGMKVLEVGTGSGYQAAILAEITPHVFTIEIIEPLYKNAQAVLTTLGYSSVAVRLGDGYYGIQEYSPFDRIIVTCAALHIPPPLFEQLKPGGKMVIPVGGPFETQRLLLVTKDQEGGRTSKTLELVRFVPLIRGTGEGR